MAYERIWVEKFSSDTVLMEVDDDTNIVFSHDQAKQLIIDLQALISGNTPDDEPVIEGVVE
jgi:hypothetical protein